MTQTPDAMEEQGTRTSSEAARERATRVVARLRDAGHESYLVGGAVRDEVMGRFPVDYDIATGAHPDEVIALFRRTESVGAAFGVVLVIEGGHTFEVATFREEGGYFDGRRPDKVVYSTIEQDVQRRDFTVNGLFADPVTGQVKDLVGGLADIRDRVIRCIGEPERRFGEDYLRVMRAVRFAVTLDFDIDPPTRRAMEGHVAGLANVSAERIRDELFKTLLSGDPARGVALLHETGILAFLLPPVADILGRMDDGIPRLGAVATQVAPQGRAAMAAAVLHPLADGKALREGFRLSSEENKAVTYVLENRDTLDGLAKLPRAGQLRAVRHEHFHLLLAVEAAWRAQLGQPMTGVAHGRRLLEETPREDLFPAPLLTGKDLLEMGLKPGPEFKRILAALEDAQLEKSVTTRDQALERVAGLVPHE